MELMEKEKSRKGFTMSEMLAAVAIAAIVLAVAVPVIMGTIRRMNLNGLDDSARSIFLAAQNSMTAMVGNGEFEDFAKDATSGADVSSHLPVDPSDFPGSGHGEKGDLRYLDSKETTHKEALNRLLPTMSIELDLEDPSHHYVVEYNCKTGAVYAVWYSDKDFDYDASSEPREYDERLKNNPLIGYYGGSGIDYALVGQMPVPELTLTNAEELRLHIKMPNLPAGSTGYGAGKIGLQVTIKGKDSDVPKSIIERTTVDTDAVVLAAGKEADIMLDTLKPSDIGLPKANENGWTVRKHFYEWASSDWPRSGSEQLIPGEDISVTVTTYYVGTDKLYLPRSVTVNCNSLFARVEKKDDPTTTSVVEEIPTAMIAYGRHLQNLDVLTATNKADGKIGVGINAAGGPAGATITAAEQTKPIDFNVSAAAGADEITSWKDTYPDTTVGADPDDIQKFVAIYNSDLSAYNGNSLPIRNLDAEGKSNDAAGLFGKIEGTSATDLIKLDNILLINPAATAEENVGALAGVARNVDIKNCKVYLEQENPADPDKAYDPAEMPQIKQSGPATNVSAGGLVGTAQDTVKITDSFASTVVNGSNGTGGLVGAVDAGDELTIEKSYAACYLSKGKQVGGLVGHLESDATVTVKNSYAAGIIENATSTAAGLVCERGTSLTFENSYAAVRYGKGFTNGTVLAKVYGTAPNVVSGYVYYISQSGVTYEADSGKKVSTKQLSKMANTTTTGGDILGGEWSEMPVVTGSDPKNQNPTYAVFPYHQTDETKSLSVHYPYPMLKAVVAPGADQIPLFQYGDWLESEDEGLLAYYEQYTDDSYGVWVPGGINTLLSDSGKFVQADGYALLVKEGDTVPTEVTVEGVSDPFTVNSSELATVPNGSDVYKLYKIENLNSLNQDSYYHKLTVGASEFWFNPFYACEIQQIDSTASPAETAPTDPVAKPGASGDASTEPGDQYDGQVVIRTARQLANMAAATGSTAGDGSTAQQAAQSRDYVQLLDIDYSQYDDVTMGKEISTPQSLAALIDDGGDGGSYDGGLHIIKNLHISGSSDVAGLFGETQGELKYIRLVNVDVHGGEGTGALAGVYSGSGVTDCGAYVESAEAYDKFTVAGLDSTGGLIGSLDGGDMTDCFAAVKVVGGNNTGGLVGSVNAEVTLTDCYAGGHTVNGIYEVEKDSENANVYGNGNVGGLVGLVADGADLTLSGINYSTCSVQVASEIDLPDVTIGLLIGYQVGNVGQESSAEAYAIGRAFDKDGNPLKSGSLRDETDYCVTNPYSTEIRATTGETAYPYDGALFKGTTAMDYPFKSGQTEHHGDWLDPNKVQASGIAYFEQMDDGEIMLQIRGYIGYAGSTTPGTEFADEIKNADDEYIDTLCTTKEAVNDVHSITRTGYVTFMTYGATEYGEVPTLDPLGDPTNSGAWVGGDFTETALAQEINDQLSAYVVNKLDGKVDLDEMPSLDVFMSNVYDTKLIDSASALSGSVEIELDDQVGGPTDTQTVYYTNGFAALADADNFGGDSNPFQVRTALQLDNIPDNVDADTYFRQTHDIDGHSYEVYLGADTFAGHFNGMGYHILGLTSGAAVKSDCTGVFKSLSGSADVRNVILYAGGTTPIFGSDPDLAADDTVTYGGIANTAEGGTLENCAVVGYDTPFNYTNNTGENPIAVIYGGLIGQVTGDVTVTNCAAVNDVTVEVPRTEVSGSFCYGGLVGYVTGGTLTLTNCYAGGTGENKDTGNVIRLPIDGQPYGLIGSGTATAENCYSWVSKSSSQVLSLAPAALGGSNYYIAQADPGSNPGASYVGTFKACDDFLADYRDTSLFPGVTGFGEAQSSYPTNDNLLYDDFPYPEVIREVDEDGNPVGDKFVHYGDWSSPILTDPKFGVFFFYKASSGTDLNEWRGSAAFGSYAVAAMFDGHGKYDRTQMGETIPDKNVLAYYCGVAIRNANKSKVDEIKDKLKVEFHGTLGYTYTFSFSTATEKTDPVNDKIENENAFKNYKLFVSNKNELDADKVADITGPGSQIVVTYDGKEVARFCWNEFYTPPSGDPAEPDGPEIFEPACSCTARCTEGAVNPYCPVCAGNPEACAVPDTSEPDGSEPNNSEPDTSEPGPGSKVSGGDVSGGDTPIDNEQDGSMSSGDESGDGEPDEADPTSGDGEGTTSPAALPPDPPKEVLESETSDPGSDAPQEGGDD